MKYSIIIALLLNNKASAIRFIDDNDRVDNFDDRKELMSLEQLAARNNAVLGDGHDFT